MISEKTQKKNYSILIVDDDKFLLDMYALKFSSEGFKVETSLSGADALSKLEGGCVVDIMLTDIVMPSMDGLELLRKIKEKNLCSEVKFIVLSNLGEDEDVKKAKDLGVDGYIIKATSTPSEVVSRVLEIVRT